MTNKILASILIISGIVIAFLSFFLNKYDISSGVLTYIAQAFITGGALLGVSVYVNNKINQIEKKLKK